jgi:hypothetical protein
MRYERLLLLLLVFFAACGPSAEQQDMQLRTVQLKQKQDSLIEKEKLLTMKEQELIVREMRLDSLLKKMDTTGVYDPRLTGNWKVKMTCIETSCTGSAVGDTRTEQWELKYQDYNVMAYAVKDGKVTRTYSGIFQNELLKLRVQKENETEADMNVDLSFANENKMEGKREIVQQDGCKIVYTLEAEKERKPLK